MVNHIPYDNQYVLRHKAPSLDLGYRLAGNSATMETAISPPALQYFTPIPSISTCGTTEAGHWDEDFVSD
jgi:hypothetical protein